MGYALNLGVRGWWLTVTLSAFGGLVVEESDVCVRSLLTHSKTSSAEPSEPSYRVLHT